MRLVCGFPLTQRADRLRTRSPAAAHKTRLLTCPSPPLTSGRRSFSPGTRAAAWVGRARRCRTERDGRQVRTDAAAAGGRIARATSQHTAPRRLPIRHHPARDD